MSDFKVSTLLDNKTRAHTTRFLNDVHRTLLEKLKNELNTSDNNKINIDARFTGEAKSSVLTVCIYNQKDITLDALKLAEKGITLFIDSNNEFVVYNKSCELGSEVVIKAINNFAVEYTNKLKVSVITLDDITSSLK